MARLPAPRLLALAVLAAAILAAVLPGTSVGQAPGGAAAPPPSVGVVEAQMRPVSAGYSFIGRVQAVNTVELRARVEGFLTAWDFTEGQEVKTGQLLYEIEKDIFQAQVDQYEAEVASAQAALANAEVQYQRALSLVRNQNVPQAEVDTRKANRDGAQAEVLLAQAQLKQAQINLGYTDIASPIDGKIGQSSFDVGNLVGPSSDPLATIVSQDPMYLVFPVSTRELLAIRESRKLPDDRLIGIEFLVRFADGSTYPHKGTWDFTAPQVDQTTDTVTMRATVPNPERLLIDGMYANVQLQERDPQQRVVIPQAALQVNQEGVHVLVVGADDKVAVQTVQIGQAIGTEIVVESGLEAGTRIIVEGIQKVRPGQTVQTYDGPARRTTGSGGASPAPAAPGTAPPAGAGGSARG